MRGVEPISTVNERRVGNKQIPNPKQGRPCRQMCAWRLIQQIPVYLRLASRKSPAHTCLWYHTQHSEIWAQDWCCGSGGTGNVSEEKNSDKERKGDNGDDYQCTGWFGKTGDTGMHFEHDIILCSGCWGMPTDIDAERVGGGEQGRAQGGVMTWDKNAFRWWKESNGLQ